MGGEVVERFELTITEVISCDMKVSNFSKLEKNYILNKTSDYMILTYI